jgi:hypothetical protein
MGDEVEGERWISLISLGAMGCGGFRWVSVVAAVWGFFVGFSGDRWCLYEV